MTISKPLSAVSTQEVLSVAARKRQEMQWDFEHYRVSATDLGLFDACMGDYLSALQACVREVPPTRQEEHMTAYIRQLSY